MNRFVPQLIRDRRLSGLHSGVGVRPGPGRRGDIHPVLAFVGVIVVQMEHDCIVIHRMDIVVSGLVQPCGHHS